jgi:hypothetical protein
MPINLRRHVFFLCGVNFASASNASLNDGHWTPTDIHQFRMGVTDKVKMKALKDMNETNETEMLLVTPISDAPTPMPPTPPPTPVPIIAKNWKTVKLETTAANYTDDTPVSEGQTKTITYKVSVVITCNPVPTTLAELITVMKRVIAEQWGFAESLITINIVPQKDGRRLAAATVEAEARTTDPVKADAAIASASDSTNLQTGLQSAGVKTTIEVATPALEAEVVVEQEIADMNDCPEGFECAPEPTPVPTALPTFMPTPLPAGATFSPTAPTASPTAPTGIPTAPTAPATEPPTAPQTEPPTAPPTEPATVPPTEPPTEPPTVPPTAPSTLAPTPPTSAPTDSPTVSEAEESGAIQTAVGCWLVLLACSVYTL